jgi:hypothetical protein
MLFNKSTLGAISLNAEYIPPVVSGTQSATITELITLIGTPVLGTIDFENLYEAIVLIHSSVEEYRFSDMSLENLSFSSHPIYKSSAY